MRDVAFSKKYIKAISWSLYLVLNSLEKWKSVDERELWRAEDEVPTRSWQRVVVLHRLWCSVVYYI